MVPTITFKQLKNVKFPVFKLPSDEVQFKDGLLTYKGRVIDDKNQTGETLGARRLQTPHKLHRLRSSCTDFTTMLKSGHLVFIDSAGNVFRYLKKEFTTIRYKKIKKVVKKETCSLLWALGVDSPFIIPRPPPADCEWVGILYLNQFPWKLYEYSEYKKPNSRKKI